MEALVKLTESLGILFKENSMVPPTVPYPRVFKPLDVQDYILAIHFKFEKKIHLTG